MLNAAVILLPLCTQLFTYTQSASVNTTDESASTGNPIVAKLRISGSDYWTEWYDVDDPDSGSGDYETVDSITSKLGTNICPSTHSISNAECRIDNDGDNSNHGDNDRLSRPCSTEGLICRNRDQPSGICNNYNIRFYCDLKDDGQTDDTNHQRSAPRFDMRIYIILAAVPVAIFVLRICWSCTFERRRRRLRRNARARRQTQDDVSINPEAFMPPPSYQELFGEGEGPFSLSRHYSLCRKCKSSQCEIFRNRLSRNSGTVNSMNSGSESSQGSSEAIDTAPTEPSPEISSTSSAESPQSVSSVSQSSSSDSDDSQSPITSSGPQVSPQTVEASQCDCPCHKRAPVVMAYDNPAYAPEVEIQDGRSPRLPGMHLSVFSLFRSPSESSLTDPPPPSYKEALKILKKNQKGNS